MEGINAEEINADEIKVGEYGRTNLGRIFIFAWLEYAEGKIDESKVLLGDGKTFENEFYYFEKGEKIVKHSRNPIDLIECGDYVNGMLVVSVIELDRENNYIPTRIVFVNRDENCTLPPLKIYNKDIKSIVTKEQFSLVEYRLEV